MRQYGEVPPWLGAKPAPQITSVSGVGENAGGGAGVQTQDGSGFGHIEVMMGKSAIAAGQIVLTFSVAPPVLFFSGAEMFGPLTITNNDGAHTSITIAWTRPGSYIVGKRYDIHYEWSVSQ